MERFRECELVGDLPAVRAAERPDGVAMVEGGRRITYRELDRRTRRVANALLAGGLAAGDRVAVLAPDSAAVYELVLGGARARAVVLGINPRLAGPEARFVLEDSRARWLFVDPALAARLGPALEGLADLRRVVSLGEGGRADDERYEAWRDAAPDDDPRLPASGDDVVVQMYTSGTTGRPKGVMLAHRSFFAVVRELRRAGDPWIGWRRDDVTTFNIPSFHVGGLWWAMTTWNHGATGVVMPSFHPGEWLRLVQEERVTKACLVPAMIRMVLSEPALARTDLSSLGTIVYGGSPIPRPLLEEGLARLGCSFAQIYGLTETGNTAVCLRPEDHLDLDSERVRAAGRAYPGVRLRVVDAERRELPPRAVGEIEIRSPANMVGYWNRPEATAETLVDGWVRTGDAGYLDEEGYVHVHDRIKDMIIYAGENVYPAEIESVLCAHPDVLEAAVIGVPDDRWGELVKAIVVPRPGRTIHVRSLLAHARASLADFKVPRSVDVVDALPRTPSGKIKKAELRRPYWEGRERQVN